MERFRERVLIVAGTDVTGFRFPSNVPYNALFVSLKVWPLKFFS